MQINLYPEMNDKIAELLGNSSEPMHIYASEYIKQLRSTIAAKDAEIERYKKEMYLAQSKLDAYLSTSDLDAAIERAEKAEVERDGAVADLNKFCTKPVTPCYSCSKHCLMPANVSALFNFCKDWEWRGLEGRHETD